MKYSFTKKIVVAVGIMLLWISTRVAAQYNDSIHYRGMVSSSGSINRTNTDIAYLLNNSLFFGVKKKKMALNTTNTWIYGKQNNNITNNDFSSTLFANVYSSIRHFYYWGLLNYNTSYSLKINNQILAGAGVAYSFIDTTTAYINISDGLLYDKSNLRTNEDYHTVRNSFRLQFHFVISKLLVIDGSDFVQHSLSRKDDYIIRSSTSFALKLYKGLNVGMTFNYNRMNITRSDNLNFTYGLSFDRYF